MYTVDESAKTLTQHVESCSFPNFNGTDRKLSFSISGDELHVTTITAASWRIDPKADYGQLNWIARQRVNLELIAAHWDDLLRLAGSLKLGRVAATGIMRTLQVADRPTRLAQALAEFGRID